MSTLLIAFSIGLLVFVFYAAEQGKTNRLEQEEREIIAKERARIAAEQQAALAQHAPKRRESHSASKKAKPPITNSSFSIQTKEFVIHPDLVGLIWFSNGPLKNYEPEQMSEHTVAEVFSEYTEPSAINTRLKIELPYEDEQIKPLDYYPSYRSLTPKQRGKYLIFLTDPYQPIEIGYVFILYYGLERHLVSGDFERAFHVIIKLRNIHANSSFQGYSADALMYTAVTRKRPDLLLAFNESITKPYHLDGLAFDSFIILRSVSSMVLSPDELIEYAASFGFTNNRYIQSDYSMFLDQVQEVLQERYLKPYFPVSQLNLDDLPVKCIGALANNSIGSYRVEVPDISELHPFIESGASVLQEAHERVKKIKRQERSKQKSSAG